MIALLLLAAACPFSEPADIAWGPDVDGVRLGLEVEESKTGPPLLRVHLRNDTKARREVYLGESLGPIVTPWFELWPSGQASPMPNRLKVSPPQVARQIYAGSHYPRTSRLAPGESRPFYQTRFYLPCAPREYRVRAKFLPPKQSKVVYLPNGEPVTSQYSSGEKAITLRESDCLDEDLR